MLTYMFNIPVKSKIEVEDFVTKEEIALWILENSYHSLPLENCLKLYSHYFDIDLNKLMELYEE